jgi:hypothetical protein
MIGVCFSKMPKGVGHRYPSPCKLKPIEGLLTTDAVRRWKTIRVKATSSEINVLESWSTENVTPGDMLWDDLKSRICAIKLVPWVKRLMPLALGQKSSGVVWINLKSDFKSLLGLKKTIDFCNMGSDVILTMAILSNSGFQESKISAILSLLIEMFSCREFYAGSAWEVNHA